VAATAVAVAEGSAVVGTTCTVGVADGSTVSVGGSVFSTVGGSVVNTVEVAAVVGSAGAESVAVVATLVEGCSWGCAFWHPASPNRVMANTTASRALIFMAFSRFLEPNSRTKKKTAQIITCYS
jgi:hypothetical protein